MSVCVIVGLCICVCSKSTSTGKSEWGWKRICECPHGQWFGSNPKDREKERGLRHGQDRVTSIQSTFRNQQLTFLHYPRSVVTFLSHPALSVVLTISPSDTTLRCSLSPTIIFLCFTFIFLSPSSRSSHSAVSMAHCTAYFSTATALFFRSLFFYCFLSAHLSAEKGVTSTREKVKKKTVLAAFNLTHVMFMFLTRWPGASLERPVCLFVHFMQTATAFTKAKKQDTTTSLVAKDQRSRSKKEHTSGHLSLVVDVQTSFNRIWPSVTTTRWLIMVNQRPWWYLKDRRGTLPRKRTRIYTRLTEIPNTNE